MWGRLDPNPVENPLSTANIVRAAVPCRPFWCESARRVPVG